MTSDQHPTLDFGFAADDDAPIRYIDRTRSYYQALGFGEPYRLGALCASTLHTPAQATGASPRDDRHHGGALPIGQGRPGARRSL